jgi:saccharopine dehydrogenase-like NADP-dependent oxidoreductase
MRKILIVGAGKSSPYLIKYLLENSQKEELSIHIADVNTNHLVQHKKNPNCIISSIDISNEKETEKYISEANLVISMLPARFHIILAKTCIKLKKDLLTASYVSDEMKNLESDVKNSGLLFLNEMGLDPGIDHMSAKKIIDELLDEGAKINSFKSYTGGLIAPESDSNLISRQILFTEAVGSIPINNKLSGSLMSTNDVCDERPTMAYSFPVNGSSQPHESLTLVLSAGSTLSSSIDK